MPSATFNTVMSLCNSPKFTQQTNASASIPQSTNEFIHSEKLSLSLQANTTVKANCMSSYFKRLKNINNFLSLVHRSIH